MTGNAYILTGLSGARALVHGESGPRGRFESSNHQDDDVQNQLLTAAATNYHKLSILKQHNFYQTLPDIGNLKWVSVGQVQGMSRQGCAPPEDSKGDSISLPYPASRGHPHAWAHGPIFYLQSQQCQPSSHAAMALVHSPASLLKGLCGELGPRQKTQDNLPSQGQPMANSIPSAVSTPFAM